MARRTARNATTLLAGKPRATKPRQGFSLHNMILSNAFCIWYLSPDSSVGHRIIDEGALVSVVLMTVKVRNASQNMRPVDTQTRVCEERQNVLGTIRLPC